MRDKAKPKSNSASLALILLMLVQGFCAMFFLTDILNDIREMGRAALTDWHTHLEIVANLGLIVGIAFEGQYLLRLLRRQAHIERALSAASGALYELMESYFIEWKLTPAETDVASFTIKGFAIAEIAALRGAAEGTVKTQLNAIYRKANVTGRSQLVSLLIEDLLDGPLVGRGRRASHVYGALDASG